MGSRKKGSPWTWEPDVDKFSVSGNQAAPWFNQTYKGVQAPVSATSPSPAPAPAPGPGPAPAPAPTQSRTGIRNPSGESGDYVITLGGKKARKARKSRKSRK